MRFRVFAGGEIDIGGVRRRCALGRSGVVPAEKKREGDGATPAGDWPLRRVFYRPDRTDRVRTHLPVQAITADDGWCDAPEDPSYNRPVRLPYVASAERLWREDAAYDLFVVIGYNDDPPRAGRGSAIFVHLATGDYAATAGCIALSRPDLEGLLAAAQPGDTLEITPPSVGASGP
ncbi:MAG TPA: L,D-transpeptidase family protein [Caulobacteraceae bacterium]|nr:L,D-transpeptidase family protein [Caulobacteraceae bacterium]